MFCSAYLKTRCCTMMTGTSCLLLSILAFYMLLQCLINYKAFKDSCDSASVAIFFNIVNFFAASIALLYFGWCATKQIQSSPSY